MAVNGWSQRPGQEVKDVSLLLSQAFALDDIVTGNSWPVFIAAVDHVVGQQDGLEGSSRVATLLARKATEGCNNLKNKWQI